MHGFNPLTGETTETPRTRIRIDEDLPMREAFATFLRERLRSVTADQ